VSLSLYLDHNVRGAVVKGLRRRGLDVLTAFEDGHAEFPDAVLLSRAAELGRIVFTQDEDFLIIADQWLRDERHFPGLIYAHQLHATVGQIVEDIQLIAEAATPAEMQDAILFLPL